MNTERRKNAKLQPRNLFCSVSFESKAILKPKTVKNSKSKIKEKCSKPAVRQSARLLNRRHTIAEISPVSRNTESESSDFEDSRSVFETPSDNLENSSNSDTNLQKALTEAVNSF